jgi:hypothetical protein
VHFRAFSDIFNRLAILAQLVNRANNNMIPRIEKISCSDKESIFVDSYSQK